MKNNNNIESTTDFSILLKKQLQNSEFKIGYDKELLRLKVAQELKKEREKQKMTQGMLADKMHLTQSVVARIESGKHTISLVTLHKIAEYLGKKIDLV